MPTGWVPKRLPLLLHELARHDLRLAHRQDRDEGHAGLRQRRRERCGGRRRQARDLGRAPLPKLRRALDSHEVVGAARAGPGIQEPREGVDDVVRRHLPAVVEPDALPEGECPRQPVARGDPELCERRRDAERLVELDETVEQLLADREAVDVAETGRIQGGRVVGRAAGDRPRPPGERDDPEHPTAPGQSARNAHSIPQVRNRMRNPSTGRRPVASRYRSALSGPSFRRCHPPGDRVRRRRGSENEGDARVTVHSYVMIASEPRRTAHL